MKIYEFDGVIKPHGTKGESLVEFPYDVKKEFGNKERIKVMLAFDNLEFRSWLTNTDYPKHYVGLTKHMREEIGKNIGGKVHITLSKYEDQITEKIYAALLAALEKQKSSKKHYESLTHSQQVEYIRWIRDAKKPVAMDKRIMEAMEWIRHKKLPEHSNA